ncbi:MAG: preprotein translocase subunit SecG [Clostridia bacterium]|nr:preprotein translocase subunit SecG [Clostridia bacterium]
MGVLETISTIIQVFLGILLLVLVLLQDSKEEGNIIVGNKGGTMGSSRDERLAKLTKWFGIAFIIFTIISSSLMLINR